MNNLFPKLTFRMMASSFSKLSYSEVRRRLDDHSEVAFRKMNNRQRSYSGFLIDLEQTQCDYSKELAAIQAPALIMHSQNDSSVPLCHPENAKTLIPHSEVCLLDSWGRLLWIGKHSAEYDQALVSFYRVSTASGHHTFIRLLSMKSFDCFGKIVVAITSYRAYTTISCNNTLLNIHRN